MHAQVDCRTCRKFALSALAGAVHVVQLVGLVDPVAPVGALILRPQRCPDIVGAEMFGIWTDGRDVSQGQTSYGNGYDNGMIKALQGLYKLESPNMQNNTTLDPRIFSKIRTLLDEKWRMFNNPIGSEVRNCHSVLPAFNRTDIMQTVSVVDESYCPVVPLKESEYKRQIKVLFQYYSLRVDFDASERNVLDAISTLLQNIAFLHPLSDKNGRSRLLLLQYLLRSEGIACGTMMFNNNKNIYFEPVEEITKLIREGIDAYDRARANNFADNPWQEKSFRQKHSSEFAVKPWSDKLSECWEKYTSASFDLGGGKVSGILKVPGTDQGAHTSPMSYNKRSVPFFNYCTASGLNSIDVPFTALARRVLQDQNRELAGSPRALGARTSETASDTIADSELMDDAPAEVAELTWKEGLRTSQERRNELRQRCTPPRENEKVLYFMRHAHKMKRTKADPDPLLKEEGHDAIQVARNNSIIVQGALSFDPEHARRRARVIVSSPLRRTMLTSILAFGNRSESAGLQWDLNADLKEIGFFECNEGVPSLGEALLLEHGMSELSETYKNLPKGWHKSKRCTDWKRLRKYLQDLPPSSIVVTHSVLMMRLLSTFMRQGEIWPYGLSDKGTFRMLSPPENCWSY